MFCPPLVINVFIKNIVLNFYFNDVFFYENKQSKFNGKFSLNFSHTLVEKETINSFSLNKRKIKGNVKEWKIVIVVKVPTIIRTKRCIFNRLLLLTLVVYSYCVSSYVCKYFFTFSEVYYENFNIIRVTENKYSSVLIITEKYKKIIKLFSLLEELCISFCVNT